MPGEILRVQVGRGAAEIKLTTSTADKTYAIADAAAAFFPGWAASVLNRFTKLTAELADAIDHYATCEARHRSTPGRLACQIILKRDEVLALARAGLTAVARRGLAAVLSAVDFVKSVEAQIRDAAFVLQRASGVYRIAAVLTQNPAPKPNPSPSPTPGPSPSPAPGPAPTPAPVSNSRCPVRLRSQRNSSPSRYRVRRQRASRWPDLHSRPRLSRRKHLACVRSWSPGPSPGSRLDHDG